MVQVIQLFCISTLVPINIKVTSDIKHLIVDFKAYLSLMEVLVLFNCIHVAVEITAIIIYFNVLVRLNYSISLV